MAKKPSSKAKDTPDKDVSPKDEATEAMTETEDSASSASKTEPEEQQSAPETPPEDVTKAEEPEAESAQSDDDTSSPAEEDAPAEETQPETSTATPAVALPAPAPQPVHKVGAAPLIMGGIAAGAIGFAAAYFGLAQQPDTRGDQLAKTMNDLSQKVESQTASLEGLSAKVDGISTTDAEALAAQTEALGSLSDRVASIEDQFETLDARLREVELRPVSESADAAAIAAYETELNAARQEIAAQRDELQSLIDQALSTENAADAAARSAMQRAATSRILAAIDSGAPFPAAVADLQSIDIQVPEALLSVADTGVASLGGLQETFPDAARAALEASRAVSGEGTGLTSFLRNQLGARSLEPREGNDPDAILSRAEAALRDGRLQDALAEIEALPEEGRAELSDWAGRAALRIKALGAAQALSETTN